ncbi:hypothetical protein [Streptomyces sp. NPDC088270]|uniref:hypothetical protein n=1 Tax=unclassified Streptomyces TaxID=2593676 RepID=UPI003430FB3C
MAPPVARIAGLIADSDLPGMPSKDTVHRIIGGSDVPPSQPDTVAVAAVLARQAGWDIDDTVMRVRALWVAAQLVVPLGDEIEGLDPFALGVSRSISMDQSPPLPSLPYFVKRAQDQWLAGFADGTERGRSAMATLVGSSGCGKSRSLQEFLRRLPTGWRLWHPYDPTRPQAALEHMAQVGPRTVVWLDDAHHYLHDPGAETAERVTAGIRTLLCDPRRGPVLVLATLWPHIWDKLTTRPEPGRSDCYAQQRELLTSIGHHWFVPRAFLPKEIEAAAHSDDPRLELAARTARDGEITQLLAGFPELKSRHRAAPPPAACLIRAAQTYRRLGHSTLLPAVMLEETALELLTDQETACLTEDWAQEAFSYCVQQCRGVPGLLMRTRGGKHDGRTYYRLSEYLDEAGGFDSASVPEVFWQAAARHAAPTDQLHLSSTARVRGSLHHVLSLAEPAAAALPQARQFLARLRMEAGDLYGAQRLYLELADSGDTTALPPLVRLALIAEDLPGASRMAAAAVAAGHANELVIMAMAYYQTDPGWATFLAHAGSAGDARGHAVLGLIALEAGNEKVAHEHFDTAVRLGLPPNGLTEADVDLLTRGARLFTEPFPT